MADLDRLLICGPRDLDVDIDLITEALFRLLPHAPEVLIHGGAKGVDTSAGAWASFMRVPVDKYPVLPSDWTKLGRAAGPIRNQKMLDKGKPSIVVAFRDRPTSGTTGMLKLAEKAGVRTEIVEIGGSG